MENTSKDMTIREAVLHIRYWVNYFKRKSIIILLVSLAGAGLGLWYALSKKPQYKASVTFVLSSDTKASGGLSSLASQFGMDLSSGGGDLFSGENIITLMRSKNIFKKVLFKPIGDSNELLINVLVGEMGLSKDWATGPRLQNAFPFSSEKTTGIQDSLLRTIHATLISDYVSIDKIDKKQSVYQADVTSTNEMISGYMVKYLVDETAAFYIDTKTKQARANLAMLEGQADSIRRMVSGTIAGNLSTLDKTYNLNPALQSQRSSTQINQLSITALSAAYGEIVKNLELARINVMKETPLFQVIDTPVFPLVKIRTSKRTMMIYGFVIGLFLVLVVLTVTEIIRKSST